MAGGAKLYLGYPERSQFMLDGITSSTVAAGCLPAVPRALLDAQCEAHWFALYTCANHEKRVAAHLVARGVEHFLPLYHSRRVWKDRRVFLDLPLFPGYLFAHFGLPARLRVLEVPGVVRLVGFKGQPYPLADADIDALRSGIRSALRMEPHPYVTRGARVRVIRGPLAGMEGILVRRKNLCRVILSLELIARSAAVEVDAADIESIL